MGRMIVRSMLWPGFCWAGKDQSRVPWMSEMARVAHHLAERL